MSSGLMRCNGQQTRKVVLSDGSGQPSGWDLTESRSSMTRWGLDADDGLVPLSLLNCVNKMFMVARSTSERLCLTCTEGHTWRKEKEPSPGANHRLGEGGAVLQEGLVTSHLHSCQVERHTATKKELMALKCQAWKQSSGNATQKVR